ncbi:hypothetical protein GCM10011529_10230 [Polymorphobacter glacialis]|uniref:Cytochrome c domain-containing protein n=1 Tax=Sandarakinorhabdus glacialis TaxID=1614636 RepID=A0A917E752_9SPHN|nr:di-heme-cytochrome C peroxidase [Polymorphobacter glacialis]GGE05799.1 hypothetical protein GCM10011529_10230 [Polymorphobacter glacialis]
MRFVFLSLAGIAAAAGLASGCVPETGAGATSPRSQGWTEKDRYGWYRGTQGSRLMPLAWFAALKQPGGAGLLSDEKYLTGFGYIPAAASDPIRMPIGFVIDRQRDDSFKVTNLRWYAGQKGDSPQAAEPWLGLNCAACHTTEIAYDGKPMRIDGGPGLGDYQSLVEAIDKSLIETRRDPARFDRFAARVLEGKDNAGNRTQLQGALDGLIDWQARTEALNGTPLRSGYARVDAFGHIYNKIVMFAGAPDPIVNPADAPVSYPFLWNIHKQRQVQWNGGAQNGRLSLGGNKTLEYGAMGRNAGEVIGVFGEVMVQPVGGIGSQLKGFPSSFNAANLDSLEVVLARLEPPKWPAAFPRIDTAKASVGQVLFARDCAGCHKTPDKQVAGQPTETMHRFGATAANNLTDIWMACNAFTYDGRSGGLKGTKEGYFSGTPLPGVAPVGTMLATTVKGALVGKKGQILKTAGNSFFGVDRPPEVFAFDTTGMTARQARDMRRQLCSTTDHALLAYKARPLDGIWATAPYLHNGSVPTLYDLLLPAAQRPKSFALGTRSYDPGKVGYAAAAPDNRFIFATVDGGGRPIDGNSNAGHDYGASRISDADRWALVEYMKTL